MTLKVIKNHSSFLSFMKFSSHNGFLRTLFDVFLGSACNVSSKIFNSGVTYNVGYELSQPISKTEFTGTPQSRTNYVS